MRHHSQSKSKEILLNLTLQTFLFIIAFLQSNILSTFTYFVNRDLGVWFIFFIWVMIASGFGLPTPTLDGAT